MSKSALKVFSAGAFMIYMGALSYCIYTGNSLAGILMVAALGVALTLAISTYRKLG
ncbi:MAG: hypothetical protein AB1458_16240 [Bacteroidota bacterium]